MANTHEIRAQFDRETIVVYQAYSSVIADPALQRQRFVSPFSFQRMTWIKPSFLWLMHRSNWGRKRGQERTLAVHITRSGWERALQLAVLTHPEPSLFPDPTQWHEEFQQAEVHVQWDTERSLRGAGLNHFSIQVGIGRQRIHEFVEDWIVRIEDVTSTVAKMRDHLRKGDEKAAKRLLPPERVYPLDAAIGRRIMSQ